MGYTQYPAEGGGGSGTVTDVSIATANGFAGSSSGGTSPALTISTTVTGIIKGNGTALSVATAPDFPTLNQNTSGTAANITASSNSTLTTLSGLTTASSLASIGTITTGVWTGTTIAIANGGTGQTTANNAVNALLPTQTSNSGKFLTTDGTNSSWATVSGGGSPGGSTTQIQYNSSGSFAGSAGMVWDSTNNRIVVTGASGNNFGGLQILSFGGTTGQFQGFEIRADTVGNCNVANNTSNKNLNIISGTQPAIQISGSASQLKLGFGGNYSLILDGTHVGFFGATIAVQQTGGVNTAGAIYTSNEQGMLQTVYNCLRTFGLLT